MPYFILSVVQWAFFYFFVSRRFFLLWKASFIGVGIMLFADYFGTKYNMYIYLKGIIYVGKIPLFHIVQTYAGSILYLNWLPRTWGKRFLYTVYASALFLALEGILHSVNAIVYPHWKLWYSYFVLITGLSALAFLSDFIIQKGKQNIGE